MLRGQACNLAQTGGQLPLMIYLSIMQDCMPDPKDKETLNDIRFICLYGQYLSLANG